MRILLLNALDMYGGGEFFVYLTATLLKKRGHNVHVSCREDTLLFKKCTAEGIQVFAVDYPKKGKGKLPGTVWKLRKYISANKIQIVHSNTNYDRTAGAFSAWLAGVKHVTNNHSFHSIRHNILHRFRNSRLTSHFIADGERTKELLIRRDGIPEFRVSPIKLGLEPGYMKKEPELGARIRKEFSVMGKDILIGNVARMVEFKGQEFLIRSFQKVLKKHPEAVLMLVGEGKLEAVLRELAGSLGVSERVIFAGFRDDLQACYSAFDIYVNSSVEGGGEAFPFTVLYALAQGLPVVATRVGDVAQMIEENMNGFIVREKDTDGMSDKLCLLASDAEKRLRMGNAGLALLEMKFTADKMIEEIERIYMNVLEG